MQTQMETRTREVLSAAAERYNLPALADTAIKFDLRGRAAGQARILGKAGETPTLALRYNLEAMQVDPDGMLRDTIPHEIAHLVTFLRSPRSAAHGREWQSVCRTLGGSGNRTHQLKLTPARKTRKFGYDVPGYGAFEIGPIRHRKIQRGAAYSVSKHGRRISIAPDHFTGES